MTRSRARLSPVPALLTLGLAALFSGSPVVATAHDAPPGPYPQGVLQSSTSPLARIPLDLQYRSPSFSDPVAVPTEVADSLVRGVAEEVLPASLAESGGFAPGGHSDAFLQK